MTEHNTTLSPVNPKSGLGGSAFLRRPMGIFTAVVFATLLVVGLALGAALFVRDTSWRTVFSDTLAPILDLFSSAVLFLAAKKSYARSKKLALAWGAIALANFLYSMGGFVWLILEVGLKDQPFPSIADALYLGYYPVFLLGAFLLVEFPRSGAELAGRVLDLAIVLGSTILCYWNLLIGLMVQSAFDQSSLNQAILLAYPIGDLVLFAALFLILYNPSKKQTLLPVSLLTGSIAVTILADSIYSYQSLLGTYVSGNILDVGWVVGSLLAALAGVAQWESVRAPGSARGNRFPEKWQRRFALFQSYSPYFWLTAVFALLIGGEMGYWPMPLGFFAFSIGVGVILVLVLARQIVTLTENGRLNSRLQKSMERILTQSAELEKANRELEDDIAVRKLAETSLVKSEEFNRRLVEASPVAIIYLDRNFTITYENQTMRRITGIPENDPHGSVGLKFFEIPSIQAVLNQRTSSALRTGKPIHGEIVHYRSLQGREADLENHTAPLTNAEGKFEDTILLAQDVTERIQSETARQKSEALFKTLFELSPDAIMLIDPQDPGIDWPIVDCNEAACRMNGYTREELIGRSIDLINITPGTPDERAIYLETVREAGVFQYVVQHRRKDGSLFFADVSTTIIRVGGRDVLVGIDHDITERKRSEEEANRRLAELEAINQVSSALRAAQTLDEMLPILLDKTLEMLQTTQGSIWLFDPGKGELSAAVVRGDAAQAGALPMAPVKPGQGIVGKVFASGQPFIAADFKLYPDLSKNTDQLIQPGIGGAVIPIRALEDVIGAFVVNVVLPRQLTPGDIHLLTTLCEIAGNAIRRISLREQTDRRLRQLTALSQIDRAITSSFDLHLSLTMLLQQVVSQLGIHAADVLLYNPASQTLEFVAGNGFRARTTERPSLRLGEGFAGRAALERRIVSIPDLAEQEENSFASKLTAGEGFVSYFGVPLLAKGQIKGVLEIYQRAPLEHDAEWLDFLNTLAGQAAIAIDNSSLFENLQRSNIELTLAYDATIEGWSRALDLRDKETEGHTQRVTDKTVQLARTFGLTEAELVQVRWGALLHDIGKMGIPDEILLKSGPLTDSEWIIMKKHPVFAYEMIAPIQYLRSALDIPYSHHEKWDGTGYPQGLNGAQIPLAARIFAVVDVWDALRSDRPYRRAWPESKVREYIRASAGSHFDPQVVKAFLASEDFTTPAEA